MIDPVSAELEQRAKAHLPWRWALLGAMTVHLAAGLGLMAGEPRPRRPLFLPSIQVRIAPGLPPRPAGVPGGPARPVVAPAAARPVATVPIAPSRKTAPVEPPVRGKPTPRPATPVPEASPSLGAAIPDQPADLAPPAAGGGTGSGLPGRGTSAGGIALGAGSDSGEVFPFTYYLNRVMGTIESNWFKPPVPPDTRCRVRCRVDRSGHLTEAGIEEPSNVPAFDRAALRAVYASAPFPPLPLGYTSPGLTLHLEFGP